MNTTQQSTARRIALVAALPVIGVLALAGCSSNDTTAATGSASTSVSTPASSSSPGTAAGSGLVAAGRSALDAVGTGTVIAVEQEAGGSSWEVRVAGADGAEQEVHTDAAGTSVTAGPTATSSDPDDLAENTRFVDAASLSWSEAASAMTGTVAGTVTELGLDDHAGAVVWEGDVVDAGNTTHSIRIDARTGDVVTNTVDTDSDD
jgi:hypothetical protein